MQLHFSGERGKKTLQWECPTCDQKREGLSKAKAHQPSDGKRTIRSLRVLSANKKTGLGTKKIKKSRIIILTHTHMCTHTHTTSTAPDQPLSQNQNRLILFYNIQRPYSGSKSSNAAVLTLYLFLHARSI